MIVVLGTTITMAQSRGGQRDFDPVERAKQTTKELTEKLDLKKDQEKTVYDLNLKTNKEMSVAFKEADGDREAMRAKMGKTREAYNKEMKKILSESQWEKYEKYQEERRKQRGQGRR